MRVGFGFTDQEASLGKQIRSSCALFLLSVSVLGIASFLVFFDFSLIRSAILQSVTFPGEFFRDLAWVFWIFLWFWSVCFTPIFLLSLLAERELRQVRQRFGRLETGRVKAVRATRVVLSVFLVFLFFFCGTLLSPLSVLERFGPRSFVTQLSFHSVNLLESRILDSAEWLFQDQSKAFPQSRLIVFVPHSYLSGSNVATGQYFRGFHSREVLMNVSSDEEAFRSIQTGPLFEGVEGARVDSENFLAEHDQASCAVDFCSPPQKNFAELFAESQPFLIGFQRIAGYLPFFRSVLPSSSHFVSDVFLKLRSAERELLSSAKVPRPVFILKLNEEPSPQASSQVGKVQSDIHLIEASLLSKRKDVELDLLKRFVARFGFAQTIIFPLPEKGRPAVFGRMLLDKLPKDFSAPQSWGFYDFAKQRYLAFGPKSQCHFVGIPFHFVSLLSSGTMPLASESLGFRSQLSLWCDFGQPSESPLGSGSVFAFSSEGPSFDWLLHNPVGVVPVSELPTGPEAWFVKKTSQRGSLQSSVVAGASNDQSLPEARRLGDEHFWSALPGGVFRVLRTGSDREVSHLQAVVGGSDFIGDFRVRLRGLSLEEMRQLSDDIGLVLEAN